MAAGHSVQESVSVCFTPIRPGTYIGADWGVGTRYGAAGCESTWQP